VHATDFELDRDLDLGTDYRWRVRAISEEALGPWSSWVDFQTFSGQAEARFTWNPANPVTGEPTRFSDASFGEPVSWSWSFGDGAVSTVRNPTHTYTESGEYTITLTVNDGSTTDSRSEVLRIERGDALFLQDGRFKVEATWRDFEGERGSAHVVPHSSDDSGLLWFFRSSNWEMLVKIIDGCGYNDHFWVFAAATTNVEYTLTVTDTLTGEVKEYPNALGNSADALADTEAFATCSSSLGAEEPTAPRTVPPEIDELATAPTEKVSDCGDPSQLCLNGDRMRVEVEWRDFDGERGIGQVVPVPIESEDSGLFWFFKANNWEMLVKVVDGCSFNQHFWVFAAATTNVEYTLRVTDTLTGVEKEYRNPLGTAAPAITDTMALATCP
jgi:PKD repeat protein